MRYEEFVQRVRDEGGVESKEAAVVLVSAVLLTLGERLSRIHRHHLAAQLPRELKPELLGVQRTERFLAEEFVNRVAGRARVDFHRALKQSRVVIHLLREAVAAGEMDDITAELPEEYDELFERRPPGPVSSATLDTHELYPK